ncbi:MAG: ATP synthase F1 subunit delta [Bacteroidales bacterium]|nr:ATP synthase F1 subunit delta [Bacteroidales bacterium]
MNESKISVRYSKALFQSALAGEVVDEVSRDMILISDICTTPDFKEMLDSPVIRPSVKRKIFHAVFRESVTDITMSLLDLVVKSGREKYLPAIARVFRSETMHHKGITECLLTTAVKIDDNVKRQVSELIKSVFKTKVELKENIDEEIIGGFILRVDDNYIDASIRNKLRKIRNELTENKAVQ